MAKVRWESLARSRVAGTGKRGAAAVAPTDFADTEIDPSWPGREDLIWHESSFDLLRGLEMSEQPLDTLPGELRALFGRR